MIRCNTSTGIPRGRTAWNKDTWFLLRDNVHSTLPLCAAKAWPAAWTELAIERFPNWVPWAVYKGCTFQSLRKVTSTYDFGSQTSLTELRPRVYSNPQSWNTFIPLRFSLQLPPNIEYPLVRPHGCHIPNEYYNMPAIRSSSSSHPKPKGILKHTSSHPSNGTQQYVPLVPRNRLNEILINKAISTSQQPDMGRREPRIDGNQQG